MRKASRRYGGQEFALAFNRIEPAGYSTGPLYFASLAIGSRHSHLDAGAYSMDQKIFSAGGGLPRPGDAVRRIVEEEAWRQVLTSLVVCLFARAIYKDSLIAEALSSLGYTYSEADLRRLGMEIYLEKQRIKREEGFRASRLRIPDRVYEISTPLGKIDEGS